MHSQRDYRHLSAIERDKIASCKAQGSSVQDIADALGRHRSTIYHELARNAGPSGYLPSEAGEKARQRSARARRRPRLKNAWLRGYVVEKMHLGWSPERISGRLGREYPGCWERNISPEAIYRYVYSRQAPPGLRACLVRRHKARGQRDGRGRKKLKILDRTPISARPIEVEERLILGHWEGDTVVSQAHKGGLHTEVERASRYLQAVKVADLRAVTTLAAQRRIFEPLPKEARKTVTLDNGGENAAHASLWEMGIATYFADTYSAWQRGSNENANGLLRRFFPKGTDFSQIPQAEINQVVERINSWPRKCLKWASAAEEFARLGKVGVASISECRT